MILQIWLLISIGWLVAADKTPYVTIDQRPSVTFFDFGENDIASAKAALRGGADAIVVQINTLPDLQILQQYINLALSVNWQRVVGLGIELKASELLPNVSTILKNAGYSREAPVFIISSNFTVLGQSEFIPVADLSEIPFNNVTQLVDELLSMRIPVVIASKDQIQRFDPEAQQLEYQTELYLDLRDAGIVIDVCCFSTDPLAPEFNGELINEIRHFMKLGGINVLTRKPAIAYAVATEFLLSDGPPRTFNFAVIAELPKLPKPNGQVDMVWKTLMNDLNVADIEFVIQLGSTYGIGQNCTEELKEFVSGEFNASARPFLYSPGENEWNNCNKAGTSSNQEIQRREDLVVDLFATGDVSLGQVKIPILRQSDLSAITREFSDYPQNILWEWNNMLFVYPSVTDIASATTTEIQQNEETIAENGHSSDGDVERTVFESSTAAIETPPKSQVQFEATVAWLELAFSEAIRRDSVGIVLAWHASDVFNYSKHAQGTIFANLRLYLEQLVIKFNKPVLLFEGGANGFRIDKPLISSVSGQSMEMLTRISCASGQWVNVEVNPDTEDFNEVFKIATQFAQIESALAPVVKSNSQTDTFLQRAETAFSLAVLGGLPFNSPVSTWENILMDISQASVSFVVHTGDIKGPNTNCSDEYFNYILESFSEVNHPLVYVPGDNEWANCNSQEAGGWDPIDRLEFIRGLFFVDTSSSLGKYPMPITSQISLGHDLVREGAAELTEGVVNGQSTGLPENAVWTREGVLFATIHLVGNNNNLAKQPQDTEEIFTERLAEFDNRNESNMKFIDTIFDEAIQNDVEGIIIFFNGNPFNQSAQNSDNTDELSIKTGFQDVMDLILNLTIEFGNPVVLVHSDDQEFLIDQPLNQDDTMNDSEFEYTNGINDVENLTRVVVPGSGQVWWLEIVVNPSSTEIFTFVPRLVRTNLIDHSPVTPIWAVDDPNKVCVISNEEQVQYPGQ